MIKRLFSVRYRLTTIRNGKIVNMEFKRKRIAKRFLEEVPDVEYWTIYKTGPLFLPERAVNWSE